MSYDLNFWKYKENFRGERDHQKIYQKLSDGLFVEGLEDLPINKILKKIHEVFSALQWQKRDDLNWESHSGRGSFQIFTTDQFFRVDCYGMDGEDMNKLIDIAIEFECPLYDPQVDKRYDNGT